MKQKLFLTTLVALLLLSLTDCNRRRRTSERQSVQSENTENARNSRVSRGKSVVKMRNNDGVYYVPCKINGTEMQFIFDTGASDVTMSLTEAIFLYKQGKLSDDDFIGTQQYQIADGSVHEGTIVVLKSVEIGNRKLEKVRASIVDNMEAPLLLGQSALAKFGKISIDYKKKEITFE